MVEFLTMPIKKAENDVQPRPLLLSNGPNHGSETICKLAIGFNMELLTRHCDDI